jgi:hypothetical protein
LFKGKRWSESEVDQRNELALLRLSPTVALLKVGSVLDAKVASVLDPSRNEVRGGKRGKKEAKKKGRKERRIQRFNACSTKIC